MIHLEVFCFFPFPKNTAIISFPTNVLPGERGGVAGLQGIPFHSRLHPIYTLAETAKAWLRHPCQHFVFSFYQFDEEGSSSSLFRFKFS